MDTPKRSTLIKALKKKSRQEPMTEDGTFIFNATGDDHRTIAITSATFVEHSLGKSIERHLPHLSEDERRELFTERGMLSNFADKIQFAYIIRLIGQQTKSDLSIIREIRNAFAHSLMIDGFHSSEVSELCRVLTLPAEFEAFGIKQDYGPRTLADTQREKCEARDNFSMACVVALIVISNPALAR